jgi:hypothetical protein
MAPVLPWSCAVTYAKSDNGNAWVIRHHASIIISSLTAQAAKRDRDRNAQQKHRDMLRAVSADASARHRLPAADRLLPAVRRQPGNGP